MRVTVELVAARVVAALFIILMIFVSGTSAGSDVSPSAWLPREGKSDRWVTATAKVRDLLARLDCARAADEKWMAAVKHRCEVLSRLKNIGGWERDSFLYLTEAMLEDLVAGTPPLKRYAGQVIPYGYWSDHMKRILGNRVVVPRDYDPNGECQLIIYFKMGGNMLFKNGKVTQPWRPSAEMCLKASGTFHSWSHQSSQVKGRLGAHVEMEEFPTALARDFAVSPDRVFLTGFSDGGFTPLFIASRYPHLVAGIMPEVANWQYGNSEQIGLYNVPVLVVDGWGDGGYVQENLFRFHTLSNMGYPIEGLMAHHGHATTPYENEEEYLQIVEWARKQRRDLYPKRVRYATWNLAWNRAYWLSIERMADPLFGSVVDATVDENVIAVSAKNVGRLRFDLSDRLVDMARTVRVEVNGRELYRGAAQSELTIDVTPPPRGRFVKSPAQHGGFTTVMERSTYDARHFLKVPVKPWTWAYGTKGTDAEKAILKSWAPKWAKADTALSEKDRRTRSIFAFGGPRHNALVARIADDLPVTFARGSFTVAGVTYDKPEHCVKFLCPNPDNPEGHMIVYACNDLEAAKKKGFYGIQRENAWGFREGDCQVYGPPDGPSRSPFVVDVGGGHKADVYVFDSGWKAPAEKPIGTAAAHFDHLSLLRLRADAIREAVGAQVGVVSGLEPGYMRWNPELPAGPITKRAIASTSAFPDFVMKCEIKGSNLKGLLSKALASTVRKDRGDPTYVQGVTLAFDDIEDNETYTLATDYHTHNSISYAVHPKEMPPYFRFKTAAEFNAGPSSRFVVDNLIQTETQVAEAVVDYVGARGTVSPRPACFDMAKYVLNSETNHFGAYDWAHVAVSRTAPDGEGSRFVRRLTLNVGVRKQADPAKAPPRRNAKSFHAFDADGEARLEAGLATLDKRLPVTIEVTRNATFALTKGDGAVWRLGRARSGSAPEMTVLSVRIANDGDEALAGRLILGSPSVRTWWGGIWMGADKDKSKRWYAGFADEIGPYRKKYLADAALLVFPDRFAEPKAIRIGGMGYNRGTVAGDVPLTLEPGRTQRLFLVFASVRAPKGKYVSNKDLVSMLASVKGDLLAKLDPMAAALNK